MATGKTSGRNLPYPLKGDPDTIAPDIKALAEALDLDLSLITTDTLAKRPSFGIKSRVFIVSGDTAANNGLIFIDTGGAWIAVNGNIREGQIAALAIATAALQALCVTTAKLAEGAVTDPKIASGKALVATGNTYMALSKITSVSLKNGETVTWTNAEARPVFATVEIQMSPKKEAGGSSVFAEVHVGGKLAANPYINEEVAHPVRIPVTVLVNAGESVTVTNAGGGNGLIENVWVSSRVI